MFIVYGPPRSQPAAGRSPEADVNVVKVNGRAGRDYVCREIGATVAEGAEAGRTVDDNVSEAFALHDGYVLQVSPGYREVGAAQVFAVAYVKCAEEGAGCGEQVEEGGVRNGDAVEVDDLEDRVGVVVVPEVVDPSASEGEVREVWVAARRQAEAVGDLELERWTSRYATPQAAA